MLPSSSSAESAKVFQEVKDELAAAGEADFWIRFEARPDLSQFSALADWDARGWAVYEALSSTADASQAAARAHLDSQRIDYEAFFITNAIKVSGGNTALVDALASLPGVDAIYPSFEILPPDPVTDDPIHAPSEVAWGVADINAPAVWDLGITGQGMVLATIDTGVQYDHPALVDSYRGNNGDGTFDHNYNWYNHGHGSDFPGDSNGHGTHVQGTMNGDDGGDNQIGVAPGATWIATNGCCPSDAALIASGEWTLAPTDLNGENPQPDLRPHVINNSWGSVVPSNDPFMEDISEAWAAAGQFGVFANGNSGPACATSGSPGSRIINYSVGNYNSSHTISGTSARGPGQDGVLKPNISAPGSQIYSAWPGGGYNTISGTSMASPHVAGAVGLLWSASPTLMGDIPGTRALLDLTAIDTENLQCGGTAENNNVFGEGRLDVLEALNQAPTDAGTLTGTVTDADSGEPLQGATVSASGPIDRTVSTAADGTYTIMLSEGDYTVGVSLFGYATDTDTVSIAEEETTTHDVALEALPSATVSGTVTDGSGQGWALSAVVSVDGTPLSTETDPDTGAYSLTVPEGTHTLTATAQVSGYHPASETVDVTGDTVVDFALLVDVVACTAPGYFQTVNLGDPETFDEPTTPEGWEVTDDEGNGQVWRFDDPGNRGNLTGGTGGFAIVDNDFYGNGNTQATGLVSPAQDFSGDGVPIVEFKQDYRVFDSFGPQWADVDYSLDGGDTWTTALRQQVESRGPETLTVAFEDAAGESDVLVRFYDYDEGWTWWWQVDDVAFGTVTCEPEDLPQITVEPDALASAQEPDTVTEHTVTITNNGSADLEWEITEAESAIGDGNGPLAPVHLPQGADRGSAQPESSGPATPVVPGANVPAVEELTEGFDDVTTLPGAGWAIVNTSEPVGVNNWFQGNPVVFNAHQGADNAYIAANFNSAGVSPGHISNWLLTPELQLGDGSEFSFWTRGPAGSAWADRLEVRLSTAGASTDVGTGFDSVGDFTEVLAVVNDELAPDGYPAAWTEIAVTLEGIDAGSTGRIALRYHVPNGGPIGDNSNFIGIDTLSYVAQLEPHACDLGTDIPWLSASPTSGTTAPGESSEVTVSIDSTGLALGDELTADLCVASNDADNPLVLVPVTLTVTDTPPPPELIVERWFGDDRYETAVAISGQHEPGVDAVFVASGLDYADALAASALAGSWEVPVLLTRNNHLPLATAAELDRLEPGAVYVLGDVNAINDAVAAAIGVAAGAEVTRLEGPHRYATAAAIAEQFDTAEVVYIATGQDFADALAGSARAGALDGPVLLVRPDHLPAATAGQLERLSPDSIRVLGKEDSVNADVEALLATYGEVTRYPGDHRYHTAVLISEDYDSAQTVWLASGQNWPDALAGAALAGSQHEPLLLARLDRIPNVTWDELLRLQPERVVLFGDTNTLNQEDVEDRLHTLYDPVP